MGAKISKGPEEASEYYAKQPSSSKEEHGPNQRPKTNMIVGELKKEVDPNEPHH